MLFVPRVWSGWTWRTTRWRPAWPRQQETVWMRSSANSVPPRWGRSGFGNNALETFLSVTPLLSYTLELIKKTRMTRRDCVAGSAAHERASGWGRSRTRETPIEGKRWSIIFWFEPQNNFRILTAFYSKGLDIEPQLFYWHSTDDVTIECLIWLIVLLCIL